MVLNRDGTVDKVTVVRASGYLPFDAAAIDVAFNAGPYPDPPRAIRSANGKIYVHWQFHRDERQCATSGVDYFILDNPRRGRRPPGRRGGADRGAARGRRAARPRSYGRRPRRPRRQRQGRCHPRRERPSPGRRERAGPGRRAGHDRRRRPATPAPLRRQAPPREDAAPRRGGRDGRGPRRPVTPRRRRHAAAPPAPPPAARGPIPRRARSRSAGSPRSPPGTSAARRRSSRCRSRRRARTSRSAATLIAMLNDLAGEEKASGAPAVDDLHDRGSSRRHRQAPRQRRRRHRRAALRARDPRARATR